MKFYINPASIIVAATTMIATIVYTMEVIKTEKMKRSMMYTQKFNQRQD